MSKLDLNEVVVMEDDKTTRADIAKALKELGCGVYEAKDSNEVIRYAEKKKLRNYILDIHMGKKREQEGLDAVEQLKSIDKSMFVGVLSNYPDRFKQMAINVGVDIFREKSSSRKLDVHVIVYRMLQHGRSLIDVELKKLETELTQPQFLSYALSVPNQSISDSNLVAFLNLTTNDQWRQEHLGSFVAFVDGKLVESNRDRMRLIENIRLRFPGKARFVRLIEEAETTIDLPSPLSIDDN